MERSKRLLTLVPRRVYNLLRRTVRKYIDDEAERMGAALAFYAVFSIVPVMVIALAIASAFFGHDAAAGHLQDELRMLFGPTVADLVRQVMVQASAPGQGPAAALYGTVVFLVGASGAFIELQAAMNKVWHDTAVPVPGWIPFLERRLISFLMVVALGVLLVMSVLLSVLVRAAGAWAETVVPISDSTLQLMNIGATLLLITPVIALLYKRLPDADVAWSHVAVGACVTSVMLVVGQVGIGMYLGNSPVVSAYGAAGSVVVVLVWVYVSAQIMLLGAEFTAVWSSDGDEEP